MSELSETLTGALERRRMQAAGVLSGCRGALALVLSLTTLVAATLAFSPAVQAHALYSCGNASGGHCYAYGYNYVPFDSDGATTEIHMVHLTCSCGNNTFIDNEMWFLDTSGPDTYWVEAGYLASSSFSPYQEYFWADHRPVDCGGCLNVHYLGGVPSGDYGQHPQFTIYYVGNNEYQVEISSPNFYHNGYSTDNSMTPDLIDLGQELAGTGGASAPDADFTYRNYWDASGTYIAIGNNYSTISADPPWLGFLGGSSNDFYTYCC